MTVTLPADLQAFVEERVKSGRAPDVNAVLAEAVRNLQLQEDEDEATHARLKAAVQEGLADLRAGRKAPLDVMAILAEVEAEFDQP
jgi:putative addiction module CopG family antidote